MPNSALSFVGPRLRAARQRQGWTLEELAGRAQLSPSTLSRLESGKRQANLELLIPLTRHLGVSVDELIRPEPPDPRVRRAEVRRHGLKITPLAPEGSPNRTFKIIYPGGRPLPEPNIHPGFDWFFVLSGSVLMRLGERELTLAAGEAAEFDTMTPHSITSAGSEPAEVISIFNQEGARIHTHSED